MHTIGVFANVTDGDGRVLLVRQNYAKYEWACAGGRLESGESLIEGLKREVWEEARCTINVKRLVGTYIAPYRDDLVVFFDAQLEKAHPWQANDEISEVGFFDSNKLPTPMSVATRLRLRDASGGHSGLVATFFRSKEGEITMEHTVTHP